MDLYDSRIIRELRNEVAQAIEEKTIAIAAGGLSDIAAYKQQCGVLQGMRKTLEMAEEIEKKINGDR